MFHRIVFACVSIFAVCAISGCHKEQVKADAAPAHAAAPAAAPVAAPAAAPAPGTCASDADCPAGERCMHGACR